MLAGCDNCIIGTRYKCTHPSCPDYDLCEGCEASPNCVHPASHPMLKIKVPLRVSLQTSIDVEGEMTIKNHTRDDKIREFQRRLRQRRGDRHDHGKQREAGGFEWYYQELPDSMRTAAPIVVDCTVHQAEPVGKGKGVAEGEKPTTEAKLPTYSESAEPRIPGGYCIVKDWANVEVPRELVAPLQPDNKPTTEAAHADEGTSRVEAAVPAVPEPEVEDQNDSITSASTLTVVETETAQDVPKARESSSDETPYKTIIFASGSQETYTTSPTREAPTPLDIFSWVRHLTIPPGCTLPAGAVFTKTWRLKHFATGTDFVFPIVRLVRQSDGGIEMSSEPSIGYTPQQIKEDDEVEISIEGLKVPDLPGREIVEVWRFLDDNGVHYGQPLRLRFTVESVASPAGSLSSSAVIMPGSTSELGEEGSVVPETITPVEAAEVAPKAMTEISTDNDDVVSINSSEDSFLDVEGFATTTEASEDREREEFDFVEGSEEETGDEL